MIQTKRIGFGASGVIFCAFFTFVAIADAGTYSGGTGKVYPYKIGNVSDWQELMRTPNDWGQRFILSADLDLKDVELIPIGNESQSFTGYFDGAGHTIRNIRMIQPNKDGLGLFGYVRKDAIIYDLRLDNVEISGRIMVGGLVGRNECNMIYSCHVTGLISGTNEIGGLIGSNYPGSIGEISVSDCTASCNVSGDNHVGGLIGNNYYYGMIAVCHASGTVTGTGNYIGGLIGTSENKITDSYFGGDVKGFNFVGGLVGASRGSIRFCYTTGTVTGSTLVGGLVGDSDYASIRNCHASGLISGVDKIGGLVGRSSVAISSCYASGDVIGSSDYIGGLIGSSGGEYVRYSFASGSVSGRWYVGGLVGANSSTIDYCYAKGSIGGFSNVGGLVGASVNDNLSIHGCFASGNVSGGGDVGGLIGKNDGPVTASFWDFDATGQMSSAGGTGKTTAEMKTLATFTGAGWDFVGVPDYRTADVWRMCVDGADYPRLSWEFSEHGDFACPDGVAMEDLLYLAGRWMASKSEGVGAADGNGDGRVDLCDFGVLGENWGK
jgi:hypothetical protein